MRVRELAGLAALTVRTVRYSHQAGVLPEPPRRANGYRDYSVDDLVALLRLRQLVGAGLPLAEAREGGHLGQSKLAAALTFTPTDLPIATLVAHLYEDELHADDVADCAAHAGTSLGHGGSPGALRCRRRDDIEHRAGRAR